MIGVGSVRAEGNNEETFLRQLRTNFPSREQRRRHATLTLPIDGMAPEQKPQYPSRSILAGHWSDDDDLQRRRGEIIYSLTPTLKKYAGQTALVFEQGQPFAGRGEPMSLRTVSLSSEAVVSYGFRPTPQLHRPAGAEQAVLLDYVLSAEAEAAETISVSASGEASVLPATQPAIIDIPLVTGRICLEDSLELCENTAYMSTHPGLVFGNQASFL